MLDPDLLDRALTLSRVRGAARLRLARRRLADLVPRLRAFDLEGRLAAALAKGTDSEATRNARRVLAEMRRRITR